MKNLSKTVISVLAAAGFAIAASAASAQTVSPTGPIVVSGTLNQSLAGGQFLTVCNVVFQGVADASGLTLNSYTGANVNGGDLACDDSLVFPIRVDAVSSSALNVQSLIVSTRFGDCAETNIPVSWNNANSSVTFPVGTTLGGGICELNGSLTVSTSTTIN